MSRVFDCFIRQLEAQTPDAGAGSAAPSTDDMVSEARALLSVLHLPRTAAPGAGDNTPSPQTANGPAGDAHVRTQPAVVSCPNADVRPPEPRTTTAEPAVCGPQKPELQAKERSIPSVLPLQNHSGHPKAPATSPEPLPAVTGEADIRPESRLVCYTEPGSPAADRFRLLRMRLRELSGLGNVRSILVTSPLPKDGKSTIALNLATVLAERGKRRVLLVDADLHHSSLAQRLNIPLPYGLADCLQGRTDPAAAMSRIEPLGWYLLAAGKPVADGSELLQSEALPALVRQLSAHFDWIIFDSPPAIPLSDAVAIAQHTDATILVVKAGSTPMKALEDTIGLIGKRKLLGVVLNGVEHMNRTYSEYREYFRAEVRQR
jgi:capsular exopolysaccharide synthesis family protein